MIFTNEERKILDYYFTSSKSDDTIYAAKPTLPLTVATYLIGRASRASKTFREIFLDMCKEVGYRLIIQYIDHSSYFPLRNPIDELTKASENFLKKWKNHNSLRDSVHIAVFCDDLSILQTKVWEHEVVAAYQEKSTRYRPFDARNVVLPTRLSQELTDEVHKSNEELVIFYNKLMDVTNKKDIARYMLPVGSRTAMGCVAPIRSWERIVNRMRIYPTQESYDMSETIKYHISLVVSSFEVKEESPVDFSFLHQIPKNCIYDVAEDRKSTFLDKIEGYRHKLSCFKREQLVDVKTIASNNPTIYIEGLIDIGAHRDLQRHRSAIQNFPDYRAFYGYDAFVMQKINKDLSEEYVKLMVDRSILFAKTFFSNFGQTIHYDTMAECQYVSLLAHMTPFHYILDRDRWEYIYKLRSGHPDQDATNEKTVHFSYSNWVKNANAEIEKRFSI